MKSMRKLRMGVWSSMWILLAASVAGCAGSATEDAGWTDVSDIGESNVQDDMTEADTETGVLIDRTASTFSGAESFSIEETDAEVDGILTVTFLDVGQGNAVLVENDGLFLLIDGGDREYSSYVVSYLKQRGVEELAYVVASHYDADHINGIVGALNVFECDMVLAPDYVTDTRVYQSFCNVISEKDIALVYPAVGETYAFGDAEFAIVCPDRYGYGDENDNSVGLRLVYGENSFLICGDAGVEMEQKMMASGMELDSDVYLASHHGSNGSSSLEFLQAVSPAAVVISVGADNSYGHPTERVLNDIASVGAEIYRTDQYGTVTVTSDGHELSFSTEREYDETVEPDETSKSDVSGAASGTAGDGVSGDGTVSGTVDAGESGTGTEVEAFYVLNHNTMKFHLPSCSSVKDIYTKNRIDFTGTREEVLEAGYVPCKRCNP